MVDPLAETHFDKSPYNYVMNNPMGYIDPFGMDTLDYNTAQPVQMGDDIRLEDGSITPNSLQDVNVYGGSGGGSSDWGWSSYMTGVPVIEYGLSSGERLEKGDYLGAAADFGTAVAEILTLGTGAVLKSGLTLAGRGMVAKGGKKGILV